MSPVVSPAVQPTSLVRTPPSPVGPGPAQYEHHARRGVDQLSTSLQPRRAKVIMEHKTIVRSAVGRRAVLVTQNSSVVGPVGKAVLGP